MGIRSEQKQKTRQRIIDAALSLSAEQGFAALSLREVAREAGIAPTSFYRHFATLDDLGLALVDEVGLILRQMMRQARRSIRADDKSVVRASMETYIVFLREHGNLFRLMIDERSGASAAFRAAIRSEIGRFVDELIEDFERQSEAKGRPMADIPLMAEAMVMMVFSYGVDALDAPIREQRDLQERLIKQLRLILLGSEAAAHGWSPPVLKK